MAQKGLQMNNNDVLPKGARKILLDLYGASNGLIEELEARVDEEDWEAALPCSPPYL